LDLGSNILHAAVHFFTALNPKTGLYSIKKWQQQT